MATADDLYQELTDVIVPFVGEDERELAADIAKQITCQTDLLFDLASEFC